MDKPVAKLKLLTTKDEILDAILYCHQETTTIGGTTYYLLKLDTAADASGTTLSASTASVARVVWGKFVYQLSGIGKILASTIYATYRAYTGGGTVNAEIDILVRKSDGTVRTTIATGVSKSSNLGSSWTTYTGANYSFADYQVVDQTDYLEIDYIANVTSKKSSQYAYLRIDDNTLGTSDQARSQEWVFSVAKTVTDAVSLSDAALCSKQLLVSDVMSLTDANLAFKTLSLTDTMSLSDLVTVISAGYIFSDGFESGDFSAWTGTEGSTSPTVESNIKHHGTYSMRCNPLNGDQSDVYKSGLTATAIMYHRSYYKFTGMPSIDNQLIDLSGVGYNSYENAVFIRVKRSAGNIYWGVVTWIGGSATENYETSPSNPQEDVWYCVELVRDVTNGRTKLYIDDTLKVDCAKSHSGNSNMVWDGISYVNYDGLTAYVDCVAVSDTYIGQEAGIVIVTVADSIGLSDVILRNKTLTISDSVGLADASLKNWTPTVADTVSLLESVLRNKAFSVLDSVGLADVIYRGKQFALTDAVSLSDAILRNKQFAVQDVLNLLDVVFRNKQLQVSDNVSLADVALALKILLLTDSISLSDAVVVVVAAVIKIVEDSIGLSDQVFRNKNVIIQDMVSFVDSILRNKQFSVTDVLALTEAVIVSKVLAVSDSVNVSDIAMALKTLKISDQIGLFDAVLRNKFMALSDQISLTDVPKTDKRLIVTDVSQLSDVVLALKALLVADVITPTDFVTVLLPGFVRVLDSVGLSDVVRINKPVAVQDILSLLDEVRRNKQLTITDVVSTVEAVVVGRILAVSDSVHVMDTVLRNKLLSILDVVGLSETVLCDKQLVVSDVTHVTDAVLRDKVLLLLDSVGLSDVVKVNKVIIVSDEFALAELVFVAKQMFHAPFYLPIRLKVSKA